MASIVSDAKRPSLVSQKGRIQTQSCPASNIFKKSSNNVRLHNAMLFFNCSKDKTLLVPYYYQWRIT